jgi:ribonuclease D
VGASGSGRRAEDLLDVIRRGSERPADPPPLTPRLPSPKPDDAPLVALSEALLRARAREAGLAYELLASRADLQAAVAAARTGAAEADVRTLKGWRRELAGAEMLELLAGKVALTVQSTDSGPRVEISDNP